MKRYFYGLALTIIFLFISGQIKASHTPAFGAYISYEWIGGTDYEVTLQVWEKCEIYSGTIPQYRKINITASPACGSSYIDSLQLVSSDTLYAYCFSCINNENPAMVLTYKKTITLGSCSFYNFGYYSYDFRAGNNAFNNASGPTTLYVESKLNLNSNIPGNNSAKFTNQHNVVLETGKTHTLNFGAIDIDGDSLRFAIVPARKDSMNNVPGYTHPSGLSIDPKTGIATYHPTGNFPAIFGVQVKEYRNGIQLAESTMDVQIMLFTDTANLAPQLTIPSSGFPAQVYPGDTIDFTFGTIDSLNDVLTLNFSSSAVNAIFTDNGAQHPSGNIFWVPTLADVNTNDHIFYVTVRDDHCSILGTNSYAFTTRVLDPNNRDVWPGDANNDLIANNIDLLTIGLAYGTTGPVRPNASINWTAQPAPLWPTFLANNLNAKYADTNGDGVVNAADTLAIIQNYGLTHNRIGAGGSATDPVLYIDLPDSVSVGQTVTAPIYLGDSALPADSIYGLAFTVFYDQNLVEPSTSGIEFFPSWMGTTGISTISIVKDFHANGTLDAAVTRIDQMNVSGFGQIGTFSYVVPDDIAGKSAFTTKTMNVIIGNVHAISASGQTIEIGGSSDSVVVSDKASGIIDKKLDNISIYPNPASEKVIIDLGKHEAESIVLMDITGKLVRDISGTSTGKIELQLSDLLSGIYMVKIKTAEGVSSYKILKP